MKKHWEYFVAGIVGFLSFLKRFYYDTPKEHPEGSHFSQLLSLVLIVLLVVFFIQVYVVQNVAFNCPVSNSDYPASKMDCDPDCPLDRALYKIVHFTSVTSVILMVVTFLWFTFLAYLRYTKNRREIKEKDQLRDLRGKETSHFLREAWVGSLSISAIPTAISLIISSYNPSFIQEMSGVEIYIALAGIMILSISFISALQEQAQITENPEYPPISKTNEMPIKKEPNEAGSESPDGDDQGKL